MCTPTLVKARHIKTIKSAAAVLTTTTTTGKKIMGYPNVLVFLTILLIFGFGSVNGLKCFMCGQYNEGVGSITPCLNYSDQHSHVYLKECSKKSEKFCVKYVSELSIVRDCATECAEKEIWETHTHCCTEDGCNGATTVEASLLVIMIPLAYLIYSYWAPSQTTKMSR